MKSELQHWKEIAVKQGKLMAELEAKNKELIEKVENITNLFISELPTGEVDAWNLLKIVKKYIDKYNQIND